MSAASSIFFRACSLAVLLFFMEVSPTKAQKKIAAAFDKSISIITENDAYLFDGADRYYSGGIFLQYRKARLKNGKKKLQQFELVQKLFMPKRKFDENDLRFFIYGYPVNTIDRPFCGYLYFKYSNQRFFSTDKMYQWGVSAGTIGNASGGEQTQKLVHRVIGLYIPVGWENQLQHNFLLNLHGAYTQQLVEKEIGISRLKIIPTASLNLGNAYINGQLSCQFAIGMMNEFENTALLNAEMGNSVASEKNYELFVYFQPQITAQAYNATIQNSLFDKTYVPTDDIKSLVYEHRIGAVYSKRRITCNIGYVFQTKELHLQQINHRYASIQLSYRFK